MPGRRRVGPNGSVLFTNVAVGVGEAALRAVGTAGGVGDVTPGVGEDVLVAVAMVDGDVAVDVDATRVLVGLDAVVLVAVDVAVGTAVDVGTATVLVGVDAVVLVAVDVPVGTAVDVGTAAVLVGLDAVVLVAVDVAVATAVDVAVGTDVDVAVDVAVGAGAVNVADGADVDVAVELDDAIGVGVDVAVGTAVSVGLAGAVLVAAAVFVAVTTAVGVFVAVAVAIAVAVGVAVPPPHGGKLGDFSGLRSGRACVLVSTLRAFARASTLAIESGPNGTITWPPGGTTTFSTKSPPGTGTNSALPPRDGGMCCISLKGRLSLIATWVGFETVTVPVTPSGPQPAWIASIVRPGEAAGVETRVAEALATIARPSASEMNPATKKPLREGMTVRSLWRGSAGWPDGLLSVTGGT